MKKLAAAFLLCLGCSPPAYYVANVYTNGPDLYTERCALDGGRYGDKPDPNHCKFARVGPVPPELASQVGAPSAGPPSAPSLPTP